MRAALDRRVLTSAAATIASALVAGLVQAVLSDTGWGPAVGAAGIAAAYIAPAGLVLSLVVRALWRSWQPLARDATDDEPAAARAAGALAFAALAILFIAAAGWLAAHAAGSVTHVPKLAALTVALGAAAGGVIAALVSYPATRALAALARRRPITAAHISRAVVALAALFALLLWPLSPYLAVFAISLIAFHALAARSISGAA